VRVWQRKAVLQNSDTLLGLGKANTHDVRALSRAGISWRTKTFKFVDVLRCFSWKGQYTRRQSAIPCRYQLAYENF